MTLVYHNNREMRREPVNTTLHQLRIRIRSGHTFVVDLEPGDATRYLLMIVPASAPHVYEHLGAFGMPPQVTNDYALVIKLSDRECQGTWVRTDFIHPSDMAPLSSNEWSQTFLAWWLTGLFTDTWEVAP